jgi:carboxypeptidase C (cathepsin A)
VDSTEHSIRADDVELAYTARVRGIPVGPDDDPLGTVHTYGYVRAGVESRDRPVMFLFNGGPGSSSQWLHLGGLGPRRVVLPDDLTAGSLPPYRLEDSPASLLDVADLVFIDPLGTGLSRAVSDEALAKTYSVSADAKLIAQTIRAWCAHEGRTGSPKYLLGESYGTLRAVFTARELLHGPSALAVNGIALISQGLNLQETGQRSGNVTGRLAALPYMAAVGWYHGLAAGGHASVLEATQAALDYAFGDYASVLFQGNRASKSTVDKTADRLCEVTGIPADTWRRHNLQLSKGQFRKLVLQDRGLVPGTMDGRYTAAAEDPGAAEREIDPTHARISPAFAALTEQYLADELGVSTGSGYRSHDKAAAGRWRYRDDGASLGAYGSESLSPFNAFEHAGVLTAYLKEIVDCRLFVGTGVYDMLTTVGAAHHLLTQYNLPADRTTERRYEAGHMAYTDRASAQRLAADLRGFLGQ